MDYGDAHVALRGLHLGRLPGAVGGRRPLPHGATDTLAASRIDASVAKAIVLVVTTAIFFGYFAVPGLLEDDDAVTTLFIARTSLLLIPVIVLVNWRRIVLGAKQTGQP